MVVIDAKADDAVADAAPVDNDEETETERGDAAEENDGEANKEEAVDTAVSAGTEVVMLVAARDGAAADDGVPNEKPIDKVDDEEAVIETGSDEKVPADEAAVKELCGKDPLGNNDETDGVVVAVSAIPAVVGAEDEVGAVLAAEFAAEGVKTGETVENEGAVVKEEEGEDEVVSNGKETEEEIPKPNREDEAPEPEPKLGFGWRKEQQSRMTKRMSTTRQRCQSLKQKEGRRRVRWTPRTRRPTRLDVVAADEAPRVEKPNGDEEKAEEERVRTQKPTEGDEAEEIVYPCIPDPDGEDKGGQASSSLAVSTRWISAAKLLQSDFATLDRGREENRRW
ncbi:hypothetical protein BHM03_00015321 [Ensete ventricosum]|nr:hypothetical protein BHM03_00015321 [Ensete ventricosum]